MSDNKKEKPVTVLVAYGSKVSKELYELHPDLLRTMADEFVKRKDKKISYKMPNGDVIRI